MDPAQLFEQAKQLHLAGRLAEAGRLYEQVLVLAPNHPETLHLRGAVALQLGQHKEALDWFDRALAVAPDHASSHTNSAAAYLALEDFAKAADAAARALALNPASMGALATQATALHKLGRHAEALAACDAGLLRDPGHVELLHLRASALDALGRPEDALQACDRALAQNPKLGAVHVLRAHALLKLDRLEDAIASYDRALPLMGDVPELLADRAAALYRLRRYDKAIADCTKALALKPDLADALLTRLKSRECLRQFYDTVADCTALIALQPDNADAFAFRAQSYKELGRLDEALADYDRAIALDPSYTIIPGDALFTALRLCHWEGLDQRIAHLLAQVEAGRLATQPFMMLAVATSPEQQKKAAGIYFDQAVRPEVSPTPFPTPPPGKLRIGYFSSDFRDHPVGHIVADLFEKHDRSRFEISCFAFAGESDHPVRKRIAATVDRLVDVSHLSDADAAALARKQGLHIAVDLNGYTAASRPGIFAIGAAPVQVNFLGYPGTMNAPSHHYVIGDRIIIPPENYAHFSERVVTMPHTYLVTNDAKRHLPTRIFTQLELGLPDDGFVFCSFNAPFKFTPEIFDIWMRLLNAVPKSVLWLSEGNKTMTANLRAEAEKRGVDPERLIFAARLPGLDYLARFRAADLFLDTFHYNAHSTASDALLVGLPVLTKRGNAFASRVAASLLATIGLPELITETSADYERTALSLATEPQKLAAIRDRLEHNIAASPVFDSQRYVRDLEDAFARMWTRHAAGLPPDHMTIGDNGE